MGGARSREDPPDDSLRSTAGIDAGRPYFFLASCPEDLLREATDLADRYGGFHCVEGDGDFAAWKGRAAGQFLTLRRLSPVGRKVIGVAIAGFGHCNEEREFLRELGSKRGHEQFELKQCGDVRDMERWLLSEGYRPPAEPAGASRSGAAAASRSGGSAAPGETGRTQRAADPGAGLWASMTSYLGGGGGGGGGAEAAAPGAWKERWLADVQHATAEAEAADEGNAEALRAAGERLSTALERARGAGVPGKELEAAQERLESLRVLQEAAERRRRCFCWCCCPETTQGGWRRVDEQDAGTAADDASTVADGEAGFGTGRHGGAAMRTLLPRPARGSSPLPAGTRCRYRSPRSGWLAAVVEGFNAIDGTLDLDIKKHAKPESIFPVTAVTEAQAWPVGTLVEYQSSSTGNWLEAAICSFNRGVGGNECSYNLDLRERAALDRIRLRIA